MSLFSPFSFCKACAFSLQNLLQHVHGGSNETPTITCLVAGSMLSLSAILFNSIVNKPGINQHARYVGQRSFSSKDTHRTDCSSWMTKVVGDNTKICKAQRSWQSQPWKFAIVTLEDVCQTPLVSCCSLFQSVGFLTVPVVIRKQTALLRYWHYVSREA